MRGLARRRLLGVSQHDRRGRSRSPAGWVATGAGVDGCVVVGVVVGVVDVVLLDGVVDVLVVDEPVVEVPASGVVEVTGGSAPSPVVEPAGASAPSAPPTRGPPRPATLSPPPASAERIMRQLARRGPTPRRPLIGGRLRGWLSCGRLCSS